jgi:mycofactocin precursor
MRRFSYVWFSSHSFQVRLLEGTRGNTLLLWEAAPSIITVDKLTGVQYTSTMLLCSRARNRQSHGGVAGNGGVIMKSPTSEVALTTHAGASTVYADKEASPQHAEVVLEEKPAAEKPKASEEILIEEISIDGMCGVY